MSRLKSSFSMKRPLYNLDVDTPLSSLQISRNGRNPSSYEISEDVTDFEVIPGESALPSFSRLGLQPQKPCLTSNDTTLISFQPQGNRVDGLSRPKKAPARMSLIEVPPKRQSGQKSPRYPIIILDDEAHARKSHSLSTFSSGRSLSISSVSSRFSKDDNAPAEAVAKSLQELGLQSTQSEAPSAPKKQKMAQRWDSSLSSYFPPSSKSTTNFVDLSTTEDDVQDLIILKTFPVEKRNRSKTTPKPIEDVIDLIDDGKDDDWSMEDSENEDEMRFLGIHSMTDICLERMQKLTIEDKPQERRKPRGLPCKLQGTKLGSCQVGTSTVAPGKNVELHNGSFLRVDTILKKGDGKIILLGKYLVRQNFQGLLMPKRRNELVWLADPPSDQREQGKSANSKAVGLTQVRRLRQITFTNQRYCNVSLRDHTGEYSSAHEAVNEGPLFCRWKRVRVSSKLQTTEEESIVAISFDEADTKRRCKRNPRIDPSALRFSWRKWPTVLGGSFSQSRHILNENGQIVTEKIQKYTFGDAFCGAGGTSRGATDAGLRLKWGFDKDERAIKSYSSNFSKDGTECMQQSVDEFLTDPSVYKRIVDILHISPPCQPFSPAHTIPSEERDEMNQAALFSVWHLLENLKPRIITIEETEGLLNRHYEWFGALINIFISLSYSVRWKVLRCEEYGVPQSRKRLCVIAAGPGETLPPFFRPTHGPPDSGLKPFVTIGQAIKNVPSHSTQHHDTDRRFRNGPRLPFKSDILAKTITCNGGVGNYHPLGQRHYTVREMACLQTFPMYHSFADTSITHARRQVGNAVPPLLAKLLFRSCIKSLQETDRGAR